MISLAGNLSKSRKARFDTTVAALAGAEVLALEPVTGGGNNRVYRAALADGCTVAAKCYPSQKEDPRDRLGAEFRGLGFLAEQGVGPALPQPVAADREAGVALYEWIEGEAVSASDPEARRPGDVDQALVLLAKLHELRLTPGAKALPPGSDPCFSAADLTAEIAGRRIRLGEVAEEHDSLQAFLLKEFDPALEEAAQRAARAYEAAGMDFDTAIPERECTLSPSDFGFHNARRRTDGSLVFLDFEYFGWDDPAKLTADILLHPGMVLSADEEAEFRQGLADINREDKTYGARLSALWSLFGLRWCLILLNEFLPERWFRRAHANGGRNRETAQARQLDKSRAMLHRVEEGKDEI
ncbi:MAG: phosphotransferase [Alphaproteobacteria bacterium]|jgi:aminoglycoside phosphotransferase (APT) family kinase protein|nr:phosphotransferase [Alphaproteobacteria bacterium]HJO88035.1 phosphotransferase [Alphaproteobacteria bacterium]